MVHKVKEVSVVVTVNPESVTRGPDSIREVLKVSQGVQKTDQKRHRGCNVLCCDFLILFSVRRSVCLFKHHRGSKKRIRSVTGDVMSTSHI